MKIRTYENWEIHPELSVKLPPAPASEHVIWRRMSTKHEGNILYWKLWNFWVRSGTRADLRSNTFFRDYESANTDTDTLLRDIGFPWRKTETEKEVWSRMGTVWNWLRDNVRTDKEYFYGLQ